MKLLVTGVEGYTGCVLAAFLQERGHQVLGIDTGYHRGGWLFSDRNLVPGFPRTLNRDIRQLDFDDLVGMDAVVHLAELPGSPVHEANPALTFEINHQAAVRVAELARAAGVARFVCASTCSVYGPDHGDRVLDERCAVDPRTPYATCKVLVERDVAAMADADFSPTFLRKATPYGPSPRMRFDTALNQACGAAATTGRCVLPGSETSWRCFIHVLDLCEAVACTLEAPRDAVHRQIFNVGQECDNVQLRDLAAVMRDLYPRSAFSFDGDPDQWSCRLSFAKFRQHVPAFRCYWNVKRGLRQLRDLFERIRLDEQTFRARHFMRNKQLTYLNESGQVDEKFFWTC